MNRVRTVPALILVSLALGCVERRLHIRSEPDGATVAVNGTEIGTTPVEWRFHHYGSVRVTLRKKGFETEQQTVRLKAPWYEYPVLDLVSDVIVPVTIKNDHYFAIDLKQRESTPKEVDLTNAAELGERAVALRDDMRAEIEKEAAERPKERPDGGESPE